MQPSLPRPVLLACLAGLTAAGAGAQPAAPPAPAVQPAASAAQAQRAGTELRVIEDDNVRIEETRVRGQLRRIVVHDKSGDKPRSYEILVGGGGRDPSQDKSAAGQRVWSILRF
jgi:hypothetical protein